MMMIKRRKILIARPGANKGATMFEFAVVAPVLFLLLIGICEFGYLLYAKLTLQHAVSEAARFGVTGRTLPSPEGGYPEGQSPRSYSIREVVRRLTPGLDHNPEVLKIILRQQTAGGVDIPIEGRTGDQGGRSFSETLIVEVEYTHPFFAPYLRTIRTIRARATMRNEFFNSP